MIYFLFFIIVYLTIVLCITVFNALTAPMVKNGPEPVEFPLVSVLIPARDEENNIGRCLDGLIRQDYPHFEILVLNDHSTDHTADVVRTFSQQNPRVKLFDGEQLPEGWTGKNWACHQLSRIAGGDILIFTDADNIHSRGAVSHTVGWMQKLGLSLFSCFPQQITVTLAEQLVVPVFDMTVYSLLPLWLTYRSRRPSLAAANGQWIAFTRDGYDRIGGHESVRSKPVEDTDLARRAKKIGEKIITAAGRDEVMGRMYHNWQEVLEGFSKNAFGLMAFKTVPFFIFLFLLCAAHILPYFFIWIPGYFIPSAIAIALNLVLRLILALKYRQPLVTGIVLNPVAIAAAIFVGINSFLCYRRGTVSWKGREVRLGSEAANL